jgi:hypothetical protein
MPVPEKDYSPAEATQPKVVKKVKKIKKTSLQPPVEPVAPQAAPLPAVPKAPIAQAPPPPAPAAAAPLLPPPPPGFVSRETVRTPAPARTAEDKTTVESRISSIDINKLTDELEKDILSSLHSEISGLLPGPSPPQAGEKPRSPAVLETSARQPSVQEPAIPPPPQDSGTLAQTRALESEQRERRVAHRLGREFDKLPVNMRNELIKTLARTDDVKVREDVVIAVSSNFEKLPPEVQSLLKALAADQDSRVREEVAFELNRNFKKINPDFRLELAQLLARDVDIKVREDMVSAIAGHYNEHPPQVRELLKLLASDRKGSVRNQVALEMKRNTDLIPEDRRAELARLIEKAAAEESRGKE